MIGYWLMAHGKQIYAVIIDAVYDNKANKEDDILKPMYIICIKSNTLLGKVAKYKSNSARNDLTPYINRDVLVYVDPNDESNYFVDLNYLFNISSL